MNINEAQLVSFVTFLNNQGSKKMLSTIELATLFDLVEACQPEPERVKVETVKIHTNVADLVGLLQAIKGGKKIDAIKAVRTLTALGLKEAKDLVEANWIVSAVDFSYDNGRMKVRITELEERIAALTDHRDC